MRGFLRLGVDRQSCWPRPDLIKGCLGVVGSGWSTHRRQLPRLCVGLWAEMPQNSVP
ncbi:hypothetical protein PIB30_105527, partial [Stylosanthes scabra]|nr:hypothetical protein [Stylosanthes scabra]